jgi:hypothetical protein
MIEDVFICASQRNDQEWSSDVVEKREFAGKKAKLASAELAKLSRRVFDNPGGNSYMSYITAKVTLRSAILLLLPLVNHLTFFIL